MSRYLVTGGAGFIGSNIVEELLRRGEKVRVLDNFLTGTKHNITLALENAAKSKGQAAIKKNFELVRGDIRNLDACKKASKGIEYVLHQAALRSVPKSVENPFLTNEINVLGTLNMLMAAKEARVRRFVYASSSSVYGDVSSFPQKESMPAKPISPYGVSKLAGENYAVAFAKTLGLETVSLRYFNVFGPRQNPESKYSAVIPALLSRILKNKPPVVEWDGRQSRDFTYVANVVEANIKAARAKGISGEVINVACGSTISILEILKSLDKILGKTPKPLYAQKRPGDVRKTYADISKLRRLLWINKLVEFEKGLRSTVQWFMGGIV
ncbi:MAG: SDR family oxidoreductase [Candidatus Omnitrophota bacterium]